MPELPEVETVVRALRPSLTGRLITHVQCLWPRQIARPTAAELTRCLPGHRITTVLRRAKYLHLPLDSGLHLIFHLRMSGHLAVLPATQQPDKHVHTIFSLNEGDKLCFRDPRKFGRVWLVEDPAEILGNLGPEPLEDQFTVQCLQTLLQKTRRQLKALLLDQKVIAGIGNIYADEALFQARLHPARPASSLTRSETQALHAGIRKVLQEGINREGASISTYVKPDGQKGDMQNAVQVFRRTGQPCKHCKSLILRTTIAQRSTHYCPTCQI